MRPALYTLMMRLAAPWLLARLIRRARSNQVPLRRWREWLGGGEGISPGAIWLHAASVGEVEAALPLARALRDQYPDRAFLVTTTTPEGATRLDAALGDAVVHQFLPLDLPGSVRRFLVRTRPVVAVVVETELWPNLYRACERYGIPLLLVSARLSPRSLPRYRRLQPLVADTLARVRVILAQDEAAAEGFRILGGPEVRVQVGGNLKFDRPLPPGHKQGADMRGQIAPSGVPVWAAVSTREGEDEAVLAAHRLVRERYPDAVLLWVPRHRERFGPAFQAARAAGFRVALRSRGPLQEPLDVLVGDTLGEIGVYLAAADVAFVGGSLVPLGGQNVLEPAALGRPVLVGPNTAHFAFAVERLLVAGALWEVADVSELGKALTQLLGDANQRERMGQSGQSVVVSGRGAVAQVLQEVGSILEKP
ncbi:3-deoxy-D-manno-octulosonic acid transferase [Thioalkalivibrio sp. ALJ1]|uniref:3-deoxy-D-manno-octulosonic acid transferase n=1 Tax=Thioalkalivibrio sp. ALJ1 TaxID=1158144 RepID=UPI0005716FE3|nr:3-deoxy-D-manno-octulosonic acid transferase [Thioalkalivibrio sp. ALJ1]